MVTQIVKLTSKFENTSIVTIEWKGRECWIARQVGAALGYADDGGRLVDRITGDWRDEMIAGVDYVKVEGEAASSLAAVATPDGGAAKVRHMILLFENGINLVCMKTDKPAGKAMRRWLADEVLPQIRRTGTYSLPVADLRAERERRLMEREKRLARAQELAEAEALRRYAAGFRDQGASVDAVRVLEVLAAEKVAGRPLPALLPPAEPEWLAPAQIAAKIGEATGQKITATRIGLTVTALGLRGNVEGKSKALLNKAPGHDKTIVTHIYSPAAVAEIEDKLRADGYILASVPPESAPPAPTPGA